MASSIGSFQPKLSTQLKIALLIFLLAGSIVLLGFPRFVQQAGTGGSNPPLGLFLAAGLTMVLFTGALFAYIKRLGLGLSKTALTLAFGYNAVIAIIKFVISPEALYLSSQKQGGLDATIGDPNSSAFYIALGIIMLALYGVVFGCMYRYFAKRLAKQEGNNPRKPHHLKKAFGLLLLGVIGVCLAGGTIVLLPAFLFLNLSTVYLAYIFGVLGGPVIISLVAAIVLAYRSLASVERQAVRTGKATLLATFFWLGLSLILIYHVLWVIFLITLVNIWPFNTYTSK